MQGGGRSLPQNLAQGGKTFGLNWLECLNSNGLPSLNNKFKDLNLQLHASTTVTNPYTFNIRGNCSFSASVKNNSEYKLTVGKDVDYIDTGDELYNYSSYYYGFTSGSMGNLSPMVFNGMEIYGLYTSHDDNATEEEGVIIFKGNTVNIFKNFKITLPWRTYKTTHGGNYNTHVNRTFYSALVNYGDFYESYVDETYNVSIEEI